jgi:prepilin-type N-terminal cleavage/methylation domain-containing protein/prepilin-type processing-associated H-X9-DG protein
VVNSPSKTNTKKQIRESANSKVVTGFTENTSSCSTRVKDNSTALTNENQSGRFHATSINGKTSTTGKIWSGINSQSMPMKTRQISSMNHALFHNPFSKIYTGGSAGALISGAFMTLQIVGLRALFWREKNFAAAKFLRYKSRMNYPRRQFPARAFSLIELLITLALIALLTTMFFGFASGKHQRNQKELCADNLQKIFLALQIYANDFHGALPLTANATTSEQPLNLLVPKYSADTSIFICPGGRDAAIPSGAPLTNSKISYAFYMGRKLDDAQKVLLSDRQIDAEPKRAGEMVFSADGKSPGNNHHKFGGNFLFADGSVKNSGPQLGFSLAGERGIVLLNPKP